MRLGRRAAVAVGDTPQHARQAAGVALARTATVETDSPVYVLARPGGCFFLIFIFFFTGPRIDLQRENPDCANLDDANNFCGKNLDVTFSKSVDIRTIVTDDF